MAARSHTTVGVIVEEFFHRDLRGFGGFGKGTQYLAGHFNHEDSPYRIKVLLAQGLAVVDRPAIRRFHDTEVLLRPPAAGTCHSS